MVKRKENVSEKPLRVTETTSELRLRLIQPTSEKMMMVENLIFIEYENV